MTPGPGPPTPGPGCCIICAGGALCVPIGRCGANDLQPLAAMVVAKITPNVEIPNFMVFPP